MSSCTLLLDRNYMALSVITWRKAIKLIVKGKAEPVENSKIHNIKTGGGTVGIPSILRLLVTIPWRAHMSKNRFSRRNILIRDNYECQYCGIKLSRSGGSIDHVMPQSRGGATDFLNCVAACKKCNETKGDRTPDEAGMKLLHKPKKPSVIVVFQHLLTNPPEEWEDYIMA